MDADWVDEFIERHREAFTPGFDLETEAIVERILLIASLLRRRQSELLAQHGLTSEEYDVLTTLLLHGGVATPGAIRRDLRLTTGAVTNRLDQLEARGFVVRQPNADDRRSLHVRLTAAGRRARGAAVGEAARSESLVTHTLNDRERKQLNRLLRKIAVACGGTPAAARSRGDRPSAPR